MDTNFTREECLELLRKKFKDVGRLPQKSDFSVDEIARIKSFFGPWSRALEAAGVKEPRALEVIENKKSKHIRTKIRMREYKIMEKSDRTKD